MSRYNDYRRYTRSSDNGSLVSGNPCLPPTSSSVSFPASREQDASRVTADKSNKAILSSMREDVCFVP